MLCLWFFVWCFIYIDHSSLQFICSTFCFTFPIQIIFHRWKHRNHRCRTARRSRGSTRFTRASSHVTGPTSTSRWKYCKGLVSCIICIKWETVNNVSKFSSPVFSSTLIAINWKWRKLALLGRKKKILEKKVFYCFFNNINQTLMNKTKSFNIN